MGTLAGALEVRKIPAYPNKLEAYVEGDIEEVEGILRVTRIRVRYKIRIPGDMREAAERAVASHPTKCPAAMTVKNCVELDLSAEYIEE